MSQSTIEVFTGSCRLCTAAMDLVREAVEPCGCTVIERSIDGPEAQAYGLRSVPSIVRDGEILFTSLPSREEAIATLRKRP